MLQITSKINHWIIFLLVLFLATTGVLGCTIFSHASIVPKLEFAYGVNEIQSGVASQYFISKVIRGLMWDWHFIAGLILTGLLYVSIQIRAFRTVASNGGYFSRLKQNPWPLLFMLTITVLCVTGMLRYYRGELDFMGEHDKFIRNLPRHIHYYASWFLLVLCVGHITHMVYLNATKIKTLISDMFTTKRFYFSFLLVSLFCITPNNLLATGSSDDSSIVIVKRIQGSEEDPLYREAMEYYKGKKGFWIEKKTFPNCPYDACEKSTETIQSFEENGERYYNIKIHDFKSAKALFDKSITETKNPFAAEKNLTMIMERINYKSKRYEDYLLEHTKKSLGLDGKNEIDKEIQKNIDLIGLRNSSQTLFRVAEIYEKGYFGIPINTIKAIDFYRTIIDRNETKNLYFMLAKSKMAQLEKK